MVESSGGSWAGRQEKSHKQAIFKKKENDRMSYCDPVTGIGLHQQSLPLSSIWARGHRSVVALPRYE